MSKWLLVVFAVGMTAFAAVQTWRLMSVRVSETKPVTTPVVSEAQYRKPSATEIFNLRSKCAELGQKILEDQVSFGKTSLDVTSRYDAKTNRCYARITTTPLDLIDPNAKERWQRYELYDGQTKELLAQAMFRSLKGSTGNVFNIRHFDNTYSSAMVYIDNKMNEDREAAQAQ